MANCEPQKRKGRFFFVCFLLISFITFPYYLALSNFIMSLSYPFFLYVWSLLFFSTVFVEIEASSCLYLISQSFLLFFFADFRYQAAFFLISFDFVLFFFLFSFSGLFFFSASLFIVVLL